MRAAAMALASSSETETLKLGAVCCPLIPSPLRFVSVFLSRLKKVMVISVQRAPINKTPAYAFELAQGLIRRVSWVSGTFPTGSEGGEPTYKIENVEF